MCKTTPVILQRLFSASKCPPTHLSMEKGLMACLAFDKKFILDDFLQEATNTDILQIQIQIHIHIQIQIHWLLIKVLSWKIFCRKPQTGSFYHNLGRRLSASGDFQDTIISRHFTNSNTSINTNTNTNSNTNTNKTWGQRISLRINVFKREKTSKFSGERLSVP